MSYEAFYNAVKEILMRQLDLSGQKVDEYMKSQEDVVKSQYNYWRDNYNGGSLEGYASGAAYSLYMLYE